MNYYRLIENINYPGRWYLGDILEDDDNWKFTYGNRVNEHQLVNNLKVEIYQDGSPMDYTDTECYGVPIISERLMQALSFSKDLQFIPTVINDITFYIMVVCKQLDCVDENKSVFDKYLPNDPVRPDKAGEYRSIYSLKIDESKINGENIFRLSKYDIMIIVDECIKNRFDNIQATGAKFLLL